MRSLLALCILATLTACTTRLSDPQGDTASATSNLQNPRIPADQYHDTLAAARRVLLDLGFTLDRDDHRFGVLTTEPLPSPTAAELWRRDNRTVALAAESTLDDLRRTVRVTLVPLTRSNPPTQYALSVEAQIDRRQAPLRYLNGSGRTVFTNLRELPAEWEARGIEPNYWHPVKRDPALEAHLTQRILDGVSPLPTEKPTD